MDSEGVSVGIGRYETTEPGVAEVAIVVDVPWRKQGVGSALLLALEPLARERGVGQFVALYLPDNRAVERLLESLGYGDRQVIDGIAHLTKELR